MERSDKPFEACASHALIKLLKGLLWTDVAVAHGSHPILEDRSLAEKKRESEQ